MPNILGNTTATTMMAEQTYNPTSVKPQSGKAVAEAIAKLLGSAPENLDTLEELAKALNEDENFSASVLAEIANKADQTYAENMFADLEQQIIDKSDEISADLGKKVDKVNGKGLSTNDFTNAYKEKIDNNIFDYAYRFENEERYLDEIFDDFIEEGLYKIYFSPIYDDEGTNNIILSVTSAGIYGEDGYEGRAIYQTKYNYGTIESRSRDVEGIWSKWEKLSVSPSDVTREINKAIGDIETALENIIAKYGLGGDAQ